MNNLWILCSAYRDHPLKNCCNVQIHAAPLCLPADQKNLLLLCRQTVAGFKYPNFICFVHTQPQKISHLYVPFPQGRNLVSA